MIEVQRVTKKYNNQAHAAVDEVSFTVNEGEIFGLIGTSGCGKTTTLKMINRLIEPTSGQVFINGKSIREQPPEELRRNIGYVIQNVGLFPHYTIEENVAVVPRLLNWEASRIGQRSRELLQLVGLEPDRYGQRRPMALSGGQQQRVGLARALAGNPDLLLMDEPFGALDPITKDQVREQFQKLLMQFNKTAILVTHDVFEAFELCDRIGVMDAGKLLQIGSPQTLLFQPQDEFVRSFFEGHRFQLEMMGVSVRDIMDHVDISKHGRDAGPSETVTGHESIADTSSVLAALEYDSDPLYIRGENDDLLIISKNDLLEGFQQVRAALKQNSDE